MNLDPTPQNPEFNAIWINWLNYLRAWLLSPNGSKTPSMTTTERDALSAEDGMIIYNTTTNQFNFYENGAWVTKGSVYE